MSLWNISDIYNYFSHCCIFEDVRFTNFKKYACLFRKSNRKRSRENSKKRSELTLASLLRVILSSRSYLNISPKIPIYPPKAYTVCTVGVKPKNHEILSSQYSSISHSHLFFYILVIEHWSQLKPSTLEFVLHALLVHYYYYFSFCIKILVLKREMSFRFPWFWSFSRKSATIGVDIQLEALKRINLRYLATQSSPIQSLTRCNSYFLRIGIKKIEWK